MQSLDRGLLSFVFAICFVTVWAFISNVASRNGGGGAEEGLTAVRQSSSPSFTGPPWITDRTVKRRIVADTPFARCEIHTVMSEDGSKVLTDDWLWFDEKDSVNVAVMNTQGQFILFRQGKYGLKESTLSTVGSMIKEGESAFEAAKRGVFEELGMGSRYTLEHSRQNVNESNSHSKNPHTAGRLVGQGEEDGSVPSEQEDWHYFGVYRTTANRGGGFSHMYILRNAVTIDPDFKGGKDEEQQQQLTIDIEQARRAVLNQNAFKEIKWAATMTYALLFLDQQKHFAESSSAEATLSEEGLV
jgi:hypothetical protein